MKIKDLIINQMNKRAYELKKGWKFFKDYERTQQTINDMMTTMADNNLRAIKKLTLNK